MSDQATNIFLVRHGETLWNTQKRWQGSQNSNLTLQGITQAQAARDLLAEQPLHCAYVSPLKRAIDTIDIILEKRDLSCSRMPELCELNLGHWEGRTQQEIEISEPQQSSNFWLNPDKFQVKGAETFQQLQQRVVEGIEKIYQQHPGENILLVSHGVAIKVAIAHYTQTPLSKLATLADPKNAELLCLSKQGEQVTVS
ncbi:MAG: histidine phosphatase family protein [Pseudomonadales bacterium]|nr:histidine phosphatase family protein [Pseudomonadales bacterium]